MYSLRFPLHPTRPSRLGVFVWLTLLLGSLTFWPGLTQAQIISFVKAGASGDSTARNTLDTHSPERPNTAPAGYQACTKPEAPQQPAANAPDQPANNPLREAIRQKLTTQPSVKVELFVMSQCPFGVQAEEALIPLLREFGPQVDFQLHYIASVGEDGQFRSLHGQPEVVM